MTIHQFPPTHFRENEIIPAYLERSRSGGGAHAWIFFEQATTASLARKLGAAMLTRTMERRHQIGLDSYDRLPPGPFGILSSRVRQLFGFPRRLTSRPFTKFTMR